MKVLFTRRCYLKIKTSILTQHQKEFRKGHSIEFPDDCIEIVSDGNMKTENEIREMIKIKDEQTGDVLLKYSCVRYHLPESLIDKILEWRDKEYSTPASEVGDPSMINGTHGVILFRNRGNA